MKIIEIPHCDSKDTTAVPVVVSLLACGATDTSTDLRTFAFDCDHHLHGWPMGMDHKAADNKHERGHRYISRLVRRHHRLKEARLKEMDSRLLLYSPVAGLLLS